MYYFFFLKSFVGVCLGKFGGNVKLIFLGYGYLVLFFCFVCILKIMWWLSFGVNDVR